MEKCHLRGEKVFWIKQTHGKKNTKKKTLLTSEKWSEKKGVVKETARERLKKFKTKGDEWIDLPQEC